MNLPAPDGPGAADPTYADLLAGCAREPIHIPGAIQPHGTLRAFDAGVAVVVSADAAADLGRTLAEVFGDDAAATIEREALGQPLTLVPPGGEMVDVVAHRSGDLLLVEAEPPSPVDLDSR